MNMNSKNTVWKPFFAGLIYGLVIGIFLTLLIEDRKIDKAIKKQNENCVALMQRINDSYKLDLPQPDTVTIIKIDTLFKEANEVILQSESQPESCITTVVFSRRIEIQSH